MKHKRNQSGFHHIAILLLVVVVAAVGLVGYRVYSTNKSPKTSNSAPAGTTIANDTFMKQSGQNCPDRQVSFTSPPMSLADLDYIRPLGAMLDGHVTPTDHVYVVPLGSLANDATQALMPADGKVVEVDAMPAQYIGDNKNVSVAPEDHRIIVAHSCRYFSIFIHVHKLSGKLSAVVGKQEPNTQKQVEIDLKAGEPLGAVGSNGFDWVPIDTTVTLSFISPKRYEAESWKIHTVSPYDLYSGSLKSQLEAKSLRSVAPIGGKIDYDQAGKLIGNWFKEGTGGYNGNNSAQSMGRYWDGHLAVVPDYIDPTGTIFSIGNWGGTAKQFMVKGSADPSKIDASSGMVKYELADIEYTFASGEFWNSTKGLARDLHVVATGPTQGTIGLQVMPGEKLKAETFQGKTAAQVSGFTSAAQIYER